MRNYHYEEEISERKYWIRSFGAVEKYWNEFAGSGAGCVCFGEGGAEADDNA